MLAVPASIRLRVIIGWLRPFLVWAASRLRNMIWHAAPRGLGATIRMHL